MFTEQTCVCLFALCFVELVTLFWPFCVCAVLMAADSDASAAPWQMSVRSIITRSSSLPSSTPRSVMASTLVKLASSYHQNDHSPRCWAQGSSGNVVELFFRWSTRVNRLPCVTFLIKLLTILFFQLMQHLGLIENAAGSELVVYLKKTLGEDAQVPSGKLSGQLNGEATPGTSSQRGEVRRVHEPRSMGLCVHISQLKTLYLNPGQCCNMSQLKTFCTQTQTCVMTCHNWRLVVLTSTCDKVCTLTQVLSVFTECIASSTWQSIIGVSCCFSKSSATVDSSEHNPATTGRYLHQDWWTGKHRKGIVFFFVFCELQGVADLTLSTSCSCWTSFA